ncbi:MAG: DUF3237 domain-containing protein [Paenibacillus sp.]|nr:DUF3237 domain-containing protein [Paenibacillus sp.]
MILGKALPYLALITMSISTQAHGRDNRHETAVAISCQTSDTVVDVTTPSLEFVMDLDVTIGEPVTIGATPHGQRLAIPITGGTFSGPQIAGTILPGGADYQTVSPDGNRTELEAIYCIRTDDGHNIHVRNRGLLVNKPYYFVTTPSFEAPADSSHSWLNDAIFTCRPIAFKDGAITLRVWKIK